MLVGDLNNDTYADGWIGDDAVDPTVNFLYGSEDGLEDADDDLSFEIICHATSDYIYNGCGNQGLGERGDIDGDGFNDVVYFSDQAEISILAGGSAGPTVPTGGFISWGVDAGQGDVSVVADITGDGLVDVVVTKHTSDGDTDPFTGEVRFRGGQAYVFEGGSHLGVPAIMSEGVPAESLDDAVLRFFGTSRYQSLGRSVTSMDVDNDENVDLAIACGTYLTDLGPRCSTLWYGPFDATGAVHSSNDADAVFGIGQALASPGDINGDGHGDFWLGGENLYLFHGAP
jgi:hypothetical protein